MAFYPTIDLTARVAAANAGEYQANPFSQGMTGEDFRMIVHRDGGERVRWWKAIKSDSPQSERDGFRYLEQFVPEDVRVLIHGSQLEIETQDFGLVRVGDLKWSSMPDEIELARGDRILLIEPTRSRIATAVITPSGGLDSLPRLFVDEIDLIVDGDGNEVDALDYQLDGNGIRWRTPPAAAYSVRYRFFPQYEFRGKVDEQAPMGKDGVRLPQIGTLRLVAEGKERGGNSYGY